jgi:hypothetical protein
VSQQPVEGIPPRERTTVREQWDDFFQAIQLARAPIGQQTEMRRAFYTGALTMFSMLVGGVDAGTEPTDFDLQWMDQISKEFDAYVVALKRGEA